MKSGCLFAVLFVLGGLIGFALLAPLLFHGGDMEKLGRSAALPITGLCGLGGLRYGIARERRKNLEKDS